MEAFLSVPVIINLAGRLTAGQIRLRTNTTLHTLMDFKDVQEDIETTGCAQFWEGKRCVGGITSLSFATQLEGTEKMQPSCSHVCSKRVKGSRHKLQWWKLQLEIHGKKLTLNVVRCCNRGFVKSPALEMESGLDQPYLIWHCFEKRLGETSTGFFESKLLGDITES